MAEATKEGDKSSRKKLTIKLDPENDELDKMQIYASIFGLGTVEEWVKWRIQFDELVRDMLLNSGGEVHGEQALLCWLADAGLEIERTGRLLPYAGFWIGRKLR